jgi:hypothetical protein
MTSEDLAGEVRRIVRDADDGQGDPDDYLARERVIQDAQARVRGVGAEQYTESDGQRFESMPLLGLIEYAREEALDLVNYGVMLAIRIERLAAAIDRAVSEQWHQEMRP